MNLQFSDEAIDTERRILDSLGGYTGRVNGKDVELLGTIPDGNDWWSLRVKDLDESDVPVGNPYLIRLLDIEDLFVY